MQAISFTMNLCSRCAPIRPSIRDELRFPWIFSNPNLNLYPVSLVVKQSYRHRLIAARIAQQGGDVVDSPENVVEEEVSGSGFEDNDPISSTYDETFKRKKVYSKNGKLSNARIRISYSHLDNLKEAVEALESFAERGSKVSPDTYMNLLQCCADLNCIELGRKFHALMSVVENVDPFVETKLVSMYAKCGCLRDARRVFDGMRHRNLFTWSAMIGAYSRAQKWEHVLDLFLTMVRDGVMPNQFLFPKILKACGKCRDLEVTKVIHSMVVRLDLCGSITVSTSILAVYAKFGKLNWARRFFDRMEKRNEVSWTAILAGFIQGGLIKEAMELMKTMESLGIASNAVTWTSMISRLSHNNQRRQAFHMFKAMLLEGVEPSAVTITSVVSACASLGKGKEIHAFSIKIGVIDNVHVGSSLIDMYCKCGDLEAAQHVFDTMVNRNVCTWNSLIGGYRQAGYSDKACDLVMKMQESGIEPDVFTWNSIMMGFFQVGLIEEAMEVRKKMESLDIAPDVVTWSSMISGLSHNNRRHQALDMFKAMLLEGVEPNAVLIRSVVSACTFFVEGKEIHAFSIKIGVMDDVYVGNSLIDMYCKCGDLESAHQVFNKMIERHVCTWTSLIGGYCQAGYNGKACELVMKMQESGLEPDVFTWNVIIMGFIQEGLIEEAMEVWKKMESLGIAPDVVTWSSMISGLSYHNRRHQALDMFKAMLLEGMEPNAVTIRSVVSACTFPVEGKEIHAFSIKIGVMDNVYVGSSVIDMYCKCGDLEAAQQVFDKMIERNVCTWTSLIGGYCRAGYNGKACELVVKMQESGVEPDVILWNVMISGYMHNGHEDLAMDLFQRMERDGKIKRSTASWNALMAGYLKLGETDKVFRIFRQMQLNSVFPDVAAVLTVLPACKNLLAANNVREMHCFILRRGLESKLSVVNSLVDTYAKSGNLRYSKILFDKMQFKDTITWNSIISGYVSHGFPDLAIGMYDMMRNSQLKPDGGTCLPVIYAFGLSGRVDDGKKAFSRMLEDNHFVAGPEHYSAMVDLFGRTGRLGEAVELIANMPLEPNLSVWSALLTASRIHSNIGLAARAVDNMLALEPRNYLVQRFRIQINGWIGKSKVDLRMRELEKENATEIRQLGRCWIELENTIYTFHTGDQSQPYLYPWIQKVTRKEMRQSVFNEGHCIEEEDIDEVSGVHSEKLALGFALINFPGKSQCIRIVKNLRMCGKCHETVKYVSKLYGREIFVNDSKRLHRFSDGQCSCRDYW